MKTPTLNLRTYGTAPFLAAVLHGGPGGPGQVAPVCRRLAEHCGVLEPLQTATSVNGLLQELHAVITAHATRPLTLIGHSWGGMLSVLFAAAHPALIKKLILVSCGPLAAGYEAAQVMQNRLARMSSAAKTELDALSCRLADPAAPDKDAAFAAMCELSTKVDSFDIVPGTNELLAAQHSIFIRIWPEVEALRSQGGFEKALTKIPCPVLALHGDDDPHPADGVKTALSSNHREFEFILLQKCGHYPWLERQAQAEFFKILQGEIE